MSNPVRKLLEGYPLTLSESEFHCSGYSLSADQDDAAYEIRDSVRYFMSNLIVIEDDRNDSIKQFRCNLYQRKSCFVQQSQGVDVCTIHNDPNVTIKDN